MDSRRAREDGLTRLDAETREIDAQIEDLTRKSLAIKTRRNDLVAISTIPNELLSRIFLDYAFAMDIFSCRWVGILAVCRRWHDVAVHLGQLWSYVSVSDGPRDGIREHLRRSGESPLTWKMRGEGTLRETCNSALLRMSGHRTRSLKVVGEPWQVQKTLDGIEQLPNLEGLSLASWPREDVEVRIPLFLRGGAPHFRGLHLSSNVFTGWERLSNLTTLVLEQTPGDTAPRSISDILAVLQRSPGLRRIDLNNYVPQDIPLTQTSWSLSTPLNFPQLKYLHLGDSYNVLLFLLEQFTFSGATSLRLSVRSSVYGADISALMVRIRRHMRAPDAPVLRSLRLDPASISLTASAAPMCESDGPDAHLVLHFPPSPERTTRGVFSRVLEALPLHAATHLNLLSTCEAKTTTGTWAHIFRRLPYLETVHMAINNGMNMAVHGLMEAITWSEKGLSRRKRRRVRRGFLSWPSHLHLISAGLTASVGVEQTIAYEFLSSILDWYKVVDLPSKPRGVPWKTLDIVRADEGYLNLQKYMEKLYRSVGDLKQDGAAWRPGPQDTSAYGVVAAGIPSNEELIASLIDLSRYLNRQVEVIRRL
ncbi:hypothetical protein FA95DRAFT_1678015 [Auriscalpium vulgare]|uniref:Uncharacterized protein n=1 Tax=Auriscalpium vulgare TaxID=40419 RepID=A0ACB8RYA6_9AGAM|nr:hypothetical protein FA95DRAFT_1678015 [Auriscalpium vulgare]